MIVQLLIGAVLLFLSIAIQSAFVGVAITTMERHERRIARMPEGLRAPVVVGAVALWMLAAQCVAVLLWAIAFLGLGVFEDMETSLYFSLVAFTTLGFGDIIPPLEWRQLAGLCATNGLLVFGVSTALIVEVLRKLWSDGAAN